MDGGTEVSYSRYTIYHKTRKILKFSAIGNILLILTTLCLYFASKSGLPTNGDVSSQPGIGDTVVCTPCSVNGREAVTTLYDTFITTYRGGGALCCLNNATDIQDNVLELTAIGDNQCFYEETASDYKLKWWSERNYAAHLYAECFTHNNHIPVLNWTTRRHRTSFIRNLTLSPGDSRKLTVPDSEGAGTYFVYSLVTFDFYKEAVIKRKQTIIHTVMKYGSVVGNCLDDRGNKLLSASLGDVHMSTRQTSYLGGIVYLKASDTLCVQAYSFDRLGKVTHIDDTLPHNNFFGMFKLK